MNSLIAAFTKGQSCCKNVPLGERTKIIYNFHTHVFIVHQFFSTQMYLKIFTQLFKLFSFLENCSIKMIACILKIYV